ncbi:hypothetical protein KKH23_03450 [Patescibacteria group bacterium]|nr:hypothetical protein [Patescibacteria group bacterium]
MSKKYWKPNTIINRTLDATGIRDWNFFSQKAFIEEEKMKYLMYFNKEHWKQLRNLT